MYVAWRMDRQEEDHWDCLLEEMGRFGPCFTYKAEHLTEIFQGEHFCCLLLNSLVSSTSELLRSIKDERWKSRLVIKCSS